MNVLTLKIPWGGGGARLSPASSSSKHSDGGNRNVGIMFGGGGGGGRAPSKAHPATRWVFIPTNENVRKRQRRKAGPAALPQEPRDVKQR